MDQINQDKIALAKQHQSLHSDGEKVLETSFRVEKYFSSPKLVKQHSIDEDEPPDLELVDPESMTVIPLVSTSNQIHVFANGHVDKREAEQETICDGITEIGGNKETETEQKIKFNDNNVSDVSEEIKASEKSVSNCDKIDEEEEQGLSNDLITDRECEITNSNKENINGTCQNGSSIKYMSQNNDQLFEMTIPEVIEVASKDASADILATEALKATVVPANGLTDISTREIVSTAVDVSAAVPTLVSTAGLTDGSTVVSRNGSTDILTATDVSAVVSPEPVVSTVVNQDSFDKSIQSQSISKDSSFEYDEIKRADDEKYQVETSGQSSTTTASKTTATATATTTTTTTPPHRFATIKKNIESASTVRESSMGQISRTYKKCKK